VALKGLYDDEINTGPPPLPYYIVPTKELLGFLYAQINKYCFLFEYILAHIAIIYWLPENDYYGDYIKGATVLL
jgi:hypothetical protein